MKAVKLGMMVALAVLSALLMGQMAAPIHTTSSVAPSQPSLLNGPTNGVAQPHLALASPSTSTGIPRTVLLETFTAEWCIYCEMESQAMYNIEHSSSESVLTIAEVHDCYSTSYCGDGYQAVDNTSMDRTTYYGVTGFPTVEFDGQHAAVGALNTLAALQNEYQDEINNASQVPGNVSIAQSATISSANNITAHTSLTSAITGSYHARMYLVEYIGKNDSTGHDLAWVVRETLVDQTVTLSAGGTTDLTGSSAVLLGWNQQKLGVVTFVQDDSTKIVENANFAPVTTLVTSESASRTTLPMDQTTNVTVTVTNSSTGTAVAGATVVFSDGGAGGTFMPSLAITDSTGMATTVYTTPTVTELTTVPITATVAASGYTEASAIVPVTVNPIAVPGIPGTLSIVPQNDSVVVDWSAPTTGGGGVTYHLYRSSSGASSGFTEIATTTATSYLDTATAGGQSYWYQVSAQNVAGFSGNASVISVSAVLATADGLPAHVGFWVQIDQQQFEVSQNATIATHLPDGTYGYAYGPGSYAYVPSGTGGTLTVRAGIESVLTLAFTPRYAVFQGTVQPANAAVTVNGTPVSVVGGAFDSFFVAGSYQVTVTYSGFQANTTTVVLTPGNTTTKSFDLQPIVAPGSGGSTSASNGLDLTQTGLIIGGVLVGAIALVLLALKLPRKGQPARRASAQKPTGRPPQSP